jgi:hypothetical protein
LTGLSYNIMQSLIKDKEGTKEFQEYIDLTSKIEKLKVQKGKLEQKKEGLIIMNGSNVDLRICETEAISEDEDEINQIGVIKSGCGLRVYPKYNSIYIEQLQKEIEEEKQDE